MEVNLIESPVQTQLTYRIPIICEYNLCVMALDKITIEGGDVSLESELYLIPGDILEFSVEGVEVDSLESDLRYAGDFVLVIVVQEDLVTPGSSCVRVEPGNPGRIQIREDIEEMVEEFLTLDFILYCSNCGCNRPKKIDSPFEKAEAYLRFHVGPRPRKRLLSDIADAGEGQKSSDSDEEGD